jgi:peptidoglycan DL-endopeptidase CwlO
LAGRTHVVTAQSRVVPRRLARLATRVISAAGATLVITALLPVATSEAAQPTTIAAAQAKINQLDDQAEQASEQFNGAQASLAQAQQIVTAASDAVVRAHALVAAEQAKIGTFSADAYESGGLTQGLAVVLETSDPAQTLDRIALLQQLSEGQSTTLAAVRTADLSYQQAMATAAQASATATALTAQLAQRQGQINAALAATQQVLGQLTAAQRAQLAAIEAAQAAADQKKATVALAAYKRQLAASAAAASRNLARASVSATVVRAAMPLSPQTGGSTVAQRAVAAAMSKLGARYVFGADGSKDFDCSGLVQWAYGQVGIRTAHYTGTFWNSYRHIPENQLQPGDLVFFYSDHHHVGIYIGGGLMINAPHTGDVVRIASVSGHGHFSGAVRVVG